jgi:hypothetical protein
MSARRRSPLSRMLYRLRMSLIRLLGGGPYIDRADQLEVQLAGCGAAALGWSTKDPATPGMWGWSPAYQDVLDLRAKYEELLARTSTADAVRTSTEKN